MSTFGTTVAIVFILIGLGLILIGIRLIVKAFAIWNWDKVEGKIITSKIEVLKNPDFMDTYRAMVTYEYTVNDTSFTGSRINYAIDNIGSLKTAEKTLVPYPKDKSVTVAFNPNDPTEAVLDQKIIAEVFFPLFLGILISAVTLYVLWLVLQA
ncbi:MAG TPA: DUF3592 domain-containing protein [Nitrospinota bacterium]|jgi:hypothetical protein|nr:DUF3592 domain-containing protein [Nitrospinota bacterium]|tara:strand:+ start:175 stop:633 length:459 start_codon:yes stop_codon:yes gene_type:complete